MPKSSAFDLPHLYHTNGETVSDHQDTVRVLYFVYHLERGGGVVSWLRQVLAKAPSWCRAAVASYQIDSGVAHDFERLGCPVRRLPSARNLPAYYRAVRELCRRWQPHIVHANNYHSGFELWGVYAAGCSVRIAHSHNSMAAYIDHPLPTRIALYLSRRLIHSLATHGLACSEQAAEAMFGKRWRTDSRWQVLHYGIDLEPFTVAHHPSAAWAEFAIPEDAVVLGHVGRLAHEKNHRFLVQLAPAVLEQIPNAYFVCVGDGELRGQLEQMIANSGLQHRFRLLGTRSDVPRLLLALIDVLLLPSFYEGLPNVVIEAQAAGVPTICSEATPAEVEIIPGAVTRLSLGCPTEKWIGAIKKAVEGRRWIHREEWRAHVAQSDFNIDVHVQRLFAMYRESLGKRCDATRIT